MIASSSALRPLRTAVSRLRIVTVAPQPLYRTLSTSLAPSAAASSSSSASAAGPSKPAKSKGIKRPASSCPAGTVMTGLSILKDQPDPVALPDDQYPDWLWTILDEPAPSTRLANAQSASPGGARRKAPGEMRSDDEFLQERKRLRVLNRENIKASNYLKAT